MSRLLAPTSKDAPADAEAASHRLLLRAGFIRPLMSGVYTFLPLGLRTLAKIEAIVRQEMDRAGAQETRFPTILPAEPWKLTGRWDAYGELMFRLRDRAGRELCLGPTHEEAVTPLVHAAAGSYRDLPLNLYQISWKYRDEARPRSGLLRAREFLMKDAYSFDRDQIASRASYDQMIDAYHRIFRRCELDYSMVEADPGLIGGDVNHEFMARADVGEDRFVSCASCGYASNLETARTAAPEYPGHASEPMQEIHTPGRPGIRAVCDLLEIEAHQMLKCIAYEVDGGPVVVLVPGDKEVDEPKLERAWPSSTIRRMDDETLVKHGLVKGYVGPQGLRATIVADHRVGAGANWVTGANKPDHHVTGANLERDFSVDVWTDVVAVEGGDPCPRCHSPLRVENAIEIGHCFQLGSVYSEPLGATFVDESGTDRFFDMGCYGIGISRVMAAIAEQHHDEKGLAWPRDVAPYYATVIPLNMDRSEVRDAGERLYEELTERAVEVVLDDRPVSAGVKFADAELLGFPRQAVIGARGIAAGAIELRTRSSEDSEDSEVKDRVPTDTAADAIVRRLRSPD